MAYTISNSCTGCTACIRVCPVNAISGERKTLHHIDAQVCISCGVCSRVCNFDAIYDDDNQPTFPLKPSQWLMPVINLDTCISCNSCAYTCPLNCLSMQVLPDRGPHPFPVLSDLKCCIGCAFCETVCPPEAISMVRRDQA